jgi:hypothetical protein
LFLAQLVLSVQLFHHILFFRLALEVLAMRQRQKV